MNGARRRLFLFSLWYFPSHFGLHVDDVARAFSEEGYEVTIVTLTRSAFELPYFDPFRGTFERGAHEWPDVVRLELARLEERGAYNPHIFLRRDDEAGAAILRRMRAEPCFLLHYFEMLLPFFNRETVATARACAVMYAGNFLRRIAAQESVHDASDESDDRLLAKLLERSRVTLPGGYALRGTDCLLSETRELPRALQRTRLRTPAFWVSRPIFPKDVAAALGCDVRARFGIPGDAKVLLYAGRPGKNARALPAILELAQQRRPNDLLFLLLVGTEPSDVLAWPSGRAQASRIRACPFVSREVLFGIMKTADVLVYPGLIDGYPKVVSEAAIARLPVVAFDSPASGLCEMGANEEIALTIKVASPGASSAAENARFAAEIDRLFADAALRASLVQRAFRAAGRMDGHHFVERVERSWVTYDRLRP